MNEIATLSELEKDLLIRCRKAIKSIDATAEVILYGPRARGSLEKGYANTYVNRLYYACFYAISALLLTRNLEIDTR